MIVFLPFDDHFRYCLTFVVDVVQVHLFVPDVIDVLIAMISVRRRC